MTEPGRRHPAIMLASLHPEGALVSTTTPGLSPFRHRMRGSGSSPGSSREDK
jgi:hypothetical protein